MHILKYIMTSFLWPIKLERARVKWPWKYEYEQIHYHKRQVWLKYDENKRLSSDGWVEYCSSLSWLYQGIIL